MLEITLDNRNGNLWEIASIATEVSWKTSRIGKPSSFEFSLIQGSPFQDSRFQVEPGNVVTVRKDGKGVFFGYVFTIDSGMDEKVKVTAYDQIRYLQANDSFTFKNRTAAQIVRQIAQEQKLAVGRLDDTGFVIPQLIEKDKKMLDVIYKALDQTLIGVKRIYTFYDDFGQLTLRNAEDLLLDFYVGDGSLMTGYDYSRSIDNETYNYVKVQRNSEQKDKENKPHVAKDSSTIAKWGLLQLYKSIDDKYTPAQADELAMNLLKLNNRVRKTLSLEAIGDLRVRAGCYVRIYVEGLDLNQPFLIEECTHQRLEEDISTMKLELKVI
ncbi:XkdQ/YqbQ family protein [Gorillibacterium sp. sgz500922]|uniref:XkdQ/YqbQ family protein n=1 Tax=Gorillibacterium sp. sgz500922 TaxID=3446694 RepID=UPI003F675D7B